MRNFLLVRASALSEGELNYRLEFSSAVMSRIHVNLEMNISIQIRCHHDGDYPVRTSGAIELERRLWYIDEWGSLDRRIFRSIESYSSGLKFCSNQMENRALLVFRSIESFSKLRIKNCSNQWRTELLPMVRRLRERHYPPKVFCRVAYPHTHTCTVRTQCMCVRPV